MILIFQALPPLLGPDDDDYHGKLPRRASYMRPEAAHALMLLESDTGGMVYTDIYRSPVAILEAYRNKPGTQPVSYSYHGYGGCFDLDVDATKKKLRKSYGEIIALAEARGFYGHRRDGEIGEGKSESWHFNYLGPDGPALLAATSNDHATWSRPAEAMIGMWYGAELQPDDAEVNDMLHQAGVSDVRTFQRKWGLRVDGIPGPITRRVLAFVTATWRVETDPLAVV